ncbi:MAG: RNA polymerase sigma-70 factor [Alistipes sp.]|jgi:RNA polymerase sigma-70 factor (ECF subfamily)|nr:RNA polymerase sigma-70 factor [Alistipes sp.]
MDYDVKNSEAIRDGDEAAFSRYYESSFDRLVTLVRRAVGDEEEARNIAQNTLIKLWQQRQRIDPAQSLDGFVSTMAWNASLDFLKKKRVRARYHDEQLYLQNGEDPAADATLLVRETARRIENAVSAMPPQRRMVWELSRNENLTYNEIADRMDISYNAVRNYIAAALKHIRSSLSTILLIFLPIFLIFFPTPCVVPPPASRTTIRQWGGLPMTDVLERTEEKIDVESFMDEFTEVFARLSPEERAYRIARGFFLSGRPTEAMHRQFYEWLSDEHNREAKRSAMERMVREYLDGGAA